jgi:putative protease
MTGMYLEHCIMSMVLMKTSSHDPCRGLCRYMQLGLSNKMKDIYPIEADQYCRSHIHLSKDLACINYLDYFLRTGVASIRIEAHRYKKNLVATVTELYAGAVKHGHIDPTLLKQLVAMSPRGFSLGAYPTGIFKTAKDLQKNDDAGLYMMGGSG